MKPARKRRGRESNTSILPLSKTRCHRRIQCKFAISRADNPSIIEYENERGGIKFASQASRARWRGKKGSVGRLREAAGEIEIHDAPLRVLAARIRPIQSHRSTILHLILRSLFVRGRINFPSQFAANAERIAG